MLIKEAEIYILPGPPGRRQATNRGLGTIEPVPPGLSGLFTHALGFRAQRPEEIVEYQGDEQPTYTATLRLVTDGPLDAYTPFGSGFSREELEWEARQFKARIAPMLVGVDAFDREFIWQRLWYAQRFFYTGRQPLDMVDNMLWELASRHARLPVYKLLGGCREQVPAYRNIGGNTIDELVADGLRAKAQGFKGCKDHSYRGVKGNSDLARALRAAVGEDFLLLHDPVESYTVDEAIKIGRVLEQCNYVWMEEPLQDYDLLGLKKLSDSLDLPILALEWIGAIGGQPFNAAPFLALQAIDILRQRGIGITGQVKLAHLAESFGVQVHGGNPQVILAITNDPLYEAVHHLQPLPPEAKLDCLGRVVVDEGYLSIAWSPEPPPEPDWDQITAQSLAII